MAERRHVQSIYETYVGKREGNKKWLKDAMSNQYETYVGKREGNKWLKDAIEMAERCHRNDGKMPKKLLKDSIERRPNHAHQWQRVSGRAPLVRWRIANNAYSWLKRARCNASSSSNTVIGLFVVFVIFDVFSRFVVPRLAFAIEKKTKCD